MNKQEFLKKVEIFIIDENISPTNFGIKAVNEPTFVFSIREGRECREATKEKVLEFMDNYEKSQSTE